MSWCMVVRHHHHPFSVLSGIVHASVGKDVPNYFSWNEKLQVSVRPTIRLHKTASLDFNWSIGLGLHFTAGCPSCHKQSLHSLCRMHGGTWWVYEPDITGQRQRIEFKIATITHKTIQNRQPSYLCDLLHPYNPTRTLRSSNTNLIEVHTL